MVMLTETAVKEAIWLLRSLLNGFNGQMSAVHDNRVLFGLSAIRPHFLDLLHYIVALQYLGKYHMFSVQVRCTCCSDEELSSIAICSSICHRHHPFPTVLNLKVFILKSITKDRLAPGAVPLCEITSLHHKLWNNSMEFGTLVCQWFPCCCSPLVLFRVHLNLSGTELSEVFAGFWSCFAIKTINDPSHSISIDFDIHEALVCDREIWRHILALQQVFPFGSFCLFDHQTNDSSELRISINFPNRVIRLD
mmetsp:Transcript_40071/g.62566  ORF Transcript_40071/g.62566 Transcript_40071/m.62566 type:complete len:250 (+) Transcript_40071:1527-2276(+)